MAVLFDVDGTLVDHDAAARRGLEAHLEREGRDVDQGTWARWIEVEDRHFDRYLAGALSFEEQRRERARDFTGRPLSDPEADAWFDGYRQQFEASWSLFDDVLPTLDALAEAELPLGAFSNVDGGYTRRKLASLGLIDRFGVVLGRDDVTEGKPAAAPFLALAAALGVPASGAIHVGDRYEVDARAARAAGLLGVWLDRPGAAPERRRPDGPLDPAVLVIDSLLDLLPLAVHGWPLGR